MFTLRIKDLQGKEYKRAIKACKKQRGTDICDLECPLILAFDWKDTKQGRKYWKKINKRGRSISPYELEEIIDYNSEDNIDAYKSNIIDLLLDLKFEFKFKNSPDDIDEHDFEVANITMNESLKNCIIASHVINLYNEKKGNTSN